MTTIHHARVDPDYTSRTTVDEILSALNRLPRFERGSFINGAVIPVESGRVAVAAGVHHLLAKESV